MEAEPRFGLKRREKGEDSTGQTVLRTEIQRYKQGASDSDGDSEDKEKKMKRGWKRKDKGKGRGLITGEAHPRRWSRLQIKDAQWSFASLRITALSSGRTKQDKQLYYLYRYC